MYQGWQLVIRKVDMTLKVCTQPCLFMLACSTAPEKVITIGDQTSVAEKGKLVSILDRIGQDKTLE